MSRSKILMRHHGSYLVLVALRSIERGNTLRQMPGIAKVRCGTLARCCENQIHDRDNRKLITRSCVSLLGGDADALYQVGVALQISANQRRNLDRRANTGLQANRTESIPDFWLREHLRDIG